MKLFIIICAVLFMPKINAIGYDGAGKNIKISVNNSIVSLRDSNNNLIYPVVYKGSTYIPIRGISTLLGYDVQWDSNKNTVIIQNSRKSASNTTTVSSPLAVREDIKIMINGEIHPMSDASGNIIYPLSYNGSVYAPIRAVSTLLGKTVNWSGSSNTVYITDRPNKIERENIDFNSIEYTSPDFIEINKYINNVISRSNNTESLSDDLNNINDIHKDISNMLTYAKISFQSKPELKYHQSEIYKLIEGYAGVIQKTNILISNILDSNNALIDRGSLIYKTFAETKDYTKDLWSLFIEEAGYIIQYSDILLNKRILVNDNHLTILEIFNSPNLSRQEINDYAKEYLSITEKQINNIVFKLFECRDKIATSLGYSDYLEYMRAEVLNYDKQDVLNIIKFTKSKLIPLYNQSKSKIIKEKANIYSENTSDNVVKYIKGIGQYGGEFIAFMEKNNLIANKSAGAVDSFSEYFQGYNIPYSYIPNEAGYLDSINKLGESFAAYINPKIITAEPGIYKIVPKMLELSFISLTPNISVDITKEQRTSLAVLELEEFIINVLEMSLQEVIYTSHSPNSAIISQEYGKLLSDYYISEKTNVTMASNFWFLRPSMILGAVDPIANIMAFAPALQINNAEKMAELLAQSHIPTLDCIDSVGIESSFSDKGMDLIYLYFKNLIEIK